MIVRINELQPDTIQTIRGVVTEVDDDDFILSNSSGSIEVDLDDFDDFDDLDDDDDDINDDVSDLSELSNFFNEISGEEVTVIGELDDDDDDDDDDIDNDFDPYRISRSNQSFIFRDPVLEDAVLLGDDDDDDIDDDFDPYRISRSNQSFVFRDSVLEDAVLLGAENDNFVHDTPDGIIVNGAIGNDSLTGGSNSDFLIGGARNDQLTGGAGFDTFLVGNGADVITDFEAAADVIHDLGNSFSDIQQILGDSGAATQVGADTVINLGEGDSVTLLNVAVEDLSGVNFSLI